MTPPTAAPWQLVAPDIFSLFDAIEWRAQRSLDLGILSPMRHAIAAIIGGDSETFGDGPAATSADPRVAPCVAFAEQFVIDVAGTTAEQRNAMFGAMGADAFTFTQVLFVSDVFARARIALGRLFDTPYLMSEGEPQEAELWPMLERFMRQVALLKALDPLTTELVRLRGARVHNCRLCQSRLSVRALDAAGGTEVFDELDDYEHASFSERQLVALRLTDALVTQPSAIDTAMAGAVRAQLSDAEVVEIVLDVVRNAANKIAVALGGDAPVVTEGVEYYDVDAAGDVVANVDRDAVRAATA
ncbi:MAG: carboxymuconolactone decarboxylase family protein [Ilumatobacteraceae bacterium]|nr:carboxymuconolactone decarboxylase family protein [Ilumatobacteraceae bacterium]